MEKRQSKINFLIFEKFSFLDAFEKKTNKAKLAIFKFLRKSVLSQGYSL